jgi:hypothetical protein
MQSNLYNKNLQKKQLENKKGDQVSMISFFYQSGAAYTATPNSSTHFTGFPAAAK